MKVLYNIHLIVDYYYILVKKLMNDGRKKKPQKHKNKTAFKITFDTQALDHQKKVSLNK